MALKGTKALMVWCQRCTEGYKDVKIDNMTKSWRDGLAFCAIIHHYRPELIDFFSLSKENVRDNCTLAFEVAERELGIPALLDPEDMAVMQVPDKLSIMTYVSQYYNYFKDKKPSKDAKHNHDKGRKLSLKGIKLKKSKDKDKEDGATPSKQAKQISTMGDKCKMCGKHVYLVERQVVDGKLFHRACFKCNKCSTTLRPGSYKNTKDPKKFECLHHKKGKDMYKFKSSMGNRTASHLAGDDDDDAIWRIQKTAAANAAAAKSGSLSSNASQESSQPTLHTALQSAVMPSTAPARPTSPAPARPTSPAPVRPSSPPPGRPVSPGPVRPTSQPPPRPTEQPSTQQQPCGAIPLHPHLTAAASARKSFLGGSSTQIGTADPAGPLVAPPRHKRNHGSLSRQTCIDDVKEGTSSKSSSHETNLDTLGSPRLTSSETSIDEPSIKETEIDEPSIKETAIDDEPPKFDAMKGVNMNTEKMDDEKKLATATTNDEDESVSDLQNMRTEKWESESVKEKQTDAVEDINDNKLNIEENEGIKETQSDLIISNEVNVHVKEQLEEDDDSLNPFGDDDDEEQDTHEITANGQLPVNADEERENKKNDKEVIQHDEKPTEIADSSNPFGDDDNDDDEDDEGGKTVQDTKTSSDIQVENSTDDPVENSNHKPVENSSHKPVENTSHMPVENSTNDAAVENSPSSAVMDRLKVQTKDLGDSGQSASSIDDIYDNDLNPFGDDDEVVEEGRSGETGGKDYNPFDESGSEEDEYDDDLNPFGDDEDEEETTAWNARVNPFTGSPPSAASPIELGAMRQRAYTDKPNRPPLPRATQDQSSMYQVKTRQQILNEMHVNRETIKKKKRPAPRRPPPPGGQSTPKGQGGVVAPPRRKKTTRKAPGPPPANGSPNKTPERPPPSSSLSPAAKPTPSPRLSLVMTENGAESGSSSSTPVQSSPRQSKPRLVITTDVQPTSDGEMDRPVPSPRRERRATSASPLNRPKKGGPSPSFTASGKRKAPMPPAIRRDVAKGHEDFDSIQNQLNNNEKQQRELEQRGITLEQKLRQTMEAEGEQENEDVLLEWFKLVNERNKLIRKEGEFIAQIQMQELEIEHADLEYQLRCLINKQEHERTDADTETEEKLLEMLVEVVTRRGSVVDRLEADRIREEEEDENIRQMMEESGLSIEPKEKSKGIKKKKSFKKKKEKAIWHVS